MKIPNKISLLFIVFLASLFFSCNNNRSVVNQKTLYQLIDNSGIDFANNIHNTDKFNIFNYRNFYNGGGVAIGDINNDGLSDVFFTANMGSNKIYLNKGNFKFDDISLKAGFTNKEDWSTGVTMIDINNDGWLDIYVCNAGYINGKAPENKLYINNHDLTFTESAAQYGLTNKGGYCTHASFFDYDGDGDLDCFIINNSFIPVNTLNYTGRRDLMAKDWPVADFLKGGGDRLLRNDNGKFIDVSKIAGIHGSLISFGLGITVGDVNGDNWPDIYVSNDFFERDYLYINQKNGTFKDELENWAGHTSLASMGADIADINNDGFPDIFTTDMLPSDEKRLKTTASFDNIDVYNLKEKSGFYHQFQQNCLQLNNGNGKFLEVANFSGVQASDWSWGALMFDADNDGLTDLYVCNGINHDVTDQDFIDFFANDVVQKMVQTRKKEEIDKVIEKMPSVSIENKVFKNLGNLKFSDEGKAWGFTQPSFSNGAAYGDLDNDGDLDIIINNVNQPAFVYKNSSRETNKNHFIGIKLIGKDKNTFAIGSKIKIYQGTQILSREVIPSRGFQSSVDYKIIVGLGNTTKIDSMLIIWPGGSKSTYYDRKVDSVYVIDQKTSDINNIKNQFSGFVSKPLLSPVKQLFDKHTEDDFNDFYSERGVPRMLSREGPKATIGDVNGDKLEDIYIGGASGQPGQLYLQQKNGTFIKKKVAEFEKYAVFEDVAVLFFDCDGDGDLDLFVGSGGNTVEANSSQYQSRLYKNDGKGNFLLDPSAFLLSGMNTAVAAAYDFDGDGDLDLFVGSRSEPLNYGISPKSFLYVNDGKGHFTDMAAVKNQEISKIGMVTGAVWANVAGDAKKELIIVGEWMAPHVFSFNGNKFVEIKTNLSNMYGWWQTIAAMDINGDGKEDLILGNIGDNFYLKANEKEPVKLYINDFDQNGIIDKILTRTVEGKDVTVFLKKDLTDQIPTLKKQNLTHHEFAGKSIQELFSKDVMKKCIVKQLNYTSSCIAINAGNGNFDVTKMPAQVQYSSLNAIAVLDVNNDGFPDIIGGGNEFGFLPQFCRLDASLGHVLLNDTKGKFKTLLPKYSGMEVRGQIRDIKQIKANGKNKILVLQNNEYPLLFEIGN